jgi:hypothetical protein
MKKLFILSFAIASSLLFVQCKKTETVLPQEEIISTVKSLSTDQLNGTSWEVLSIYSEPNAIDLRWEVKYPKLSFNNGILDMKLGRDLCSKEYLNSDNKLDVTSISSCSISNPSHSDLYNLFEGQFEISYSLENSDELFVKSLEGTVLKLRKINSFSTTVNTSTLSAN